MLVGGCVGDELMGATQSEVSLSHCSMGKSMASLTSPELQSAVSRSLLAKDDTAIGHSNMPPKVEKTAA
jgi:hypothetical protein